MKAIEKRIGRLEDAAAVEHAEPGEVVFVKPSNGREGYDPSELEIVNGLPSIVFRAPTKVTTAKRRWRP